MLVLRLTWNHWQRILERLTRDPRSVLAGPTGLQREPDFERILARQLEPAARDQLDRWLARWRELLIVGAMTEPSRTAAHDVMAACSETAHHQITVLVIGIDQAAGYLAAGRSFERSWAGLDTLEIVGPAMPCWKLSLEAHAYNRLQKRVRAGERDADVAWRSRAEPPITQESRPDSLPAYERWSRCIGALTLPVWQRLCQLPVAIVGCGRSGSLTAQMFALLGIESLVLIDPDRVELANLDAMFGVTENDIGRPKVDALADGLQQVRHDLKVTPINDSVQSARAIRALRSVELIVTTVDSDKPRLLVAQFVNAFLKVHLDIGTGIFANASTDLRTEPREVPGTGSQDRVTGADVRLLLPGNGCVACVGGLRGESDARYELLAPPTALRRGPLLEWWKRRAGSLVTLNATAVSCGLQMWLDLVAGRIEETQWIRLEWNANGQAQIRPLEVASPQCNVCGEPGGGEWHFGAQPSS